MSHAPRPAACAPVLTPCLVSFAGRSGKDGASAWPDRPRWDDGTWAKVRQKASTKYPKHCMWYLVGKCTRPDCGRLHETPDDFDSFKAEFPASDK